MKNINIRLFSFIFIIAFITTALFVQEYCFADDFDESAAFLRERNIISDDFDAGMPVTRAEFLKMTVLSLDKNIGFFGTSFSDVTAGSPYYPYISFAEKEKIITGADGKFMPDSLITRQEAAVILSRAYHTDNTRSFNISKYPDGIYIADYALAAMAYMSGEGIINGDERGIRPEDNLTAGEAARIIYRIMRIAGKEHTGDIITDFAEGYPKMRAGGISGGFNLTVKTTSECNIYYTLSAGEYSVFNRIIPENFLVSVTDEDAEVDVYIPAEGNRLYTIYFCTVDKRGNRGNIVSIKNVIPNPYTTGSGTEEDPYIISSENQLYSVRYFRDKAFRMKNDIVLSGEWEPIGDDKNPFTGIFDGGGFCISGLSVSQKDFGGLFGYIKDGCVKNLHVSAQRITCDERGGVIAGEISGGVIDNCLTEGIVEAREKNGGGIAGINGGTIVNSQSAAAAVRAGNYSGGICGTNKGVIDSCMSAVYLVKADMYASGIAGINEGGVIRSSCAVNMNLVDDMAKNSGRVTTNRRGGTLENNYSYDLMYAVNTSAGGKNSINGEYTTIEDFSDREFYRKKAGWDFDGYWREGDELFLIPTLLSFDRPDTERGLTVYAPIAVYTKEDFLNIQNNPSAHYALMKDIELGEIRPLCGDEENGFSGSIDGRGHSVSGVQLEYDKDIGVYGLFGYITGGFIKNINAERIYVSGNDITGGFAGVNYGTLSDITVKNTNIRADQITGDNVTAGVLAAVNYGTVKNCDVRADITVRGNNITAGTIIGYNEGVISHSLAMGKIKASGYENSSAAVGGICGFNNSLLSELFADVDISAKSRTAYLGGVAGMSDGGEIYKASAMGDIEYSKKGGLVYSGGIFALGSGIKLSHCHSRNNIRLSGGELYAGGIGGYNLKSNLQCSYSLSKITADAERDGFVGGIAGINEEGFINSNVGAAEIVTRCNKGRITARTSPSGANNNYAAAEKGTDKNNKDSNDNKDNENNGIAVTDAEIHKGSFYFNAVADGGRLGWQNIYSGGDIWKWGSEINPSYKYPLLENTPGQEYFAYKGI